MTSPFEVWEERAKISKLFRFLGLKAEIFEEGVCRITLPFREGLEQLFGVVHGGFVSLIADTAGYFAAASRVGEIPLATAEIKMNFLSPVYRTDMYALARVVKAGKQITVCELKVYNAKTDKLVAIGLASYARIAANKGQPTPIKSEI